MNKKMLLAGFVAAGFITLTGFAAKTLAEQRAEIDAAIQAKLTELRTMKQQECDERVAAEAGIRFDKTMADRAAEDAKLIAQGKKPKKRGGTKGTTSVDPLPQGTTPKPTTTEEDKAKGRMSGQTAKEEDDKAKGRMSGEKPKDEEKKAKSRMSGGKPGGK